jgi:hypothetical protein
MLASARNSRRTFLAQSAAVGSSLLFPSIITAQKSGSRVEVGDGAHRYEAIHDWPQLPSEFTWQTTHNVAVDQNEHVYVIHEGRADQPDHPSIFVFDADGKYVRSFGKEFQGGGHGIEVHSEGTEQFLYVCAYQQKKTFAKLTLTGETVWKQKAPMKSGVYAAHEDEDQAGTWGRDRFMPTNIAFLKDGGFLLADGYGAFYIHRFDKDGKWISCFGGAGAGEGKFDTPHGLWIDQRAGEDLARVVVTDRAHHSLQTFSLDGTYQSTLTGFGLPANVDTFGELMVIPELLGCVSLLDKDNRVVARLGDDAERIKADSQFTIRGNAAKWLPGKFVHPHDACFDADGNIYVAEWVGTGRVTKLRKLDA